MIPVYGNIIFRNNEAKQIVIDKINDIDAEVGVEGRIINYTGVVPSVNPDTQKKGLYEWDVDTNSWVKSGGGSSNQKSIILEVVADTEELEEDQVVEGNTITYPDLIDSELILLILDNQPLIYGHNPYTFDSLTGTIDFTPMGGVFAGSFMQILYKK